MNMKEHMELVRNLNVPKTKVKKTKKNESK